MNSESKKNKPKRILVVLTLLVGLLAILFSYTNCAANKSGRHRMGGGGFPLTSLGTDLSGLHEQIEPPVSVATVSLNDTQIQFSMADSITQVDGTRVKIEFGSLGGCGVYGDEVGSVRILSACNVPTSFRIQYNYFADENTWYDIGTLGLSAGARLPISCSNIPDDCTR